ncbi:hypothetical protein L7F22_034164 [Adiantum nelumboides]|nr:hypothetical protein [Adiantum nelumboides]
MTSLVTIVTIRIFVEVLERNNLPGAIFTTVCGGAEIGEAISRDSRIALASFTSSSKVGRIVQSQVSSRFGRCLLELSGNNAIVVMDDANNQSLPTKARTLPFFGHSRDLGLFAALQKAIVGGMTQIKNQRAQAIGVGETGVLEVAAYLPRIQFLEDPYFEWLHWPQASLAFSDEELDYIRRLDAKEDADRLQT